MRPAVVLSALLAGRALVAAQTSTSTSASSTNSASSSSSSGTGSSSSSTSTISSVLHGVSVSPIGSTYTNPSAVTPTGSYQSYTSAITLSSSRSVGNASSTSSNTLLVVGGTSSTSTMTGNSTRSSTSTTSSATPTNTQACNNYPEFCTRKYSNITEVAAHNAAFVQANSAFSNQEIEIVGQLNDGVRMIQGEVHYVNNTLYNCHTSCSYLNAGTYESLLVTVREWVQANPYDVVTLLIANSDLADVNNFTQPFQDSGILPYVYTPPKIPMHAADWPTLGEMILSNQRVVVFMDYQANASAVPYIIDQYSSVWETPFSPVDPAFPCTVQRPPNLAESDARNNYMYLANHNLNVEVSFLGLNILIPDFSQLATVNADNSSESSLLTMTQNCDSMWGKPPNFLIVDFYNIGSGSVFEVAAKFNNVTYNRPCCGQDTSISGAATLMPSMWTLFLALMAPCLLLWS